MPRNKYPEETEQKILDASLKLFVEKGYDNTTVLDIVDNLGGLTRGAFYHHFKSKEEVMCVLTDRLFYENNPFELIKREKNLNGLQKIQKIIKDSMEDNDYRRLCAQAVSLLKNPQFLAEFMESNNELIMPSYLKLIEEGISDGSIRAHYPKQTAEILTFLTNMWLVPTLFPYDESELNTRMHVIKIITDSLGLPVMDEEMMRMIETFLRENTSDTE